MLDKCSARLLELAMNGCTWEELLRGTGAPPSSVYWHLRKLIRCGMIEARGRRRQRYRATLKGAVICSVLGCAGAVERTAEELGLGLVEAAALASAFMSIVERENVDLAGLHVTREGVLSTVLAWVIAAPGADLGEKVLNSLGDASLTPIIRDLMSREAELLKGGKGEASRDDLNPH